MRENVAASRAPLASRNHLLVGPVGIHDEDLIALQIVACRLKNQSLAVGRKIRFGVRPAKSELPNVAQMLFFRHNQSGGRISRRLRTGHPRRRQSGKQCQTQKRSQGFHWRKSVAGKSFGWRERSQNRGAHDYKSRSPRVMASISSGREKMETSNEIRRLAQSLGNGLTQI